MPQDKEIYTEIEFYIRAEVRESIEEVARIGYNPVSIENLHAKLYFN